MLYPEDRNDILKLNINGTLMTMKRETLCSRGTMLQHLFNKNYDESLVRDENGYIYLEWNPQYFEIIQKWLIAKQFDENLPLPLECLAMQAYEKEN